MTVMNKSDKTFTLRIWLLFHWLGIDISLFIKNIVLINRRWNSFSGLILSCCSAIENMLKHVILTIVAKYSIVLFISASILSVFIWHFILVFRPYLESFSHLLFHGPLLLSRLLVFVCGLYCQKRMSPLIKYFWKFWIKRSFAYFLLITSDFLPTTVNHNIVLWETNLNMDWMINDLRIFSFTTLSHYVETDASFRAKKI